VDCIRLVHIAVQRLKLVNTATKYLLLRNKIYSYLQQLLTASQEGFCPAELVLCLCILRDRQNMNPEKFKELLACSKLPDIPNVNWTGVRPVQSQQT
jgi:hypothetical protein